MQMKSSQIDDTVRGYIFVLRELRDSKLDCSLNKEWAKISEL